MSNQSKEDRRKHFSETHPPIIGDEQLHPDLRMVNCPGYLLYDSEREVRHGKGYVLGDGSHYDPVTGSFFGVTTED
jgi:hypothetical protein